MMMNDGIHHNNIIFMEVYVSNRYLLRKLIRRQPLSDQMRSCDQKWLIQWFRRLNFRRVLLVEPVVSWI